jgi:uncharacterized membrane protein
MNKKRRKQNANSSNLNASHLRPEFLPALLSNLLVFGVFIYCYWLVNYNMERYEAIVQEDELIEWATTWAFVLASLGSMLGVVLEKKKLKKFQWFYLGLSIFCFLVAMEEISWGQRLFGYRPPNYFLENNFQQEFTAHNIVNKTIRIISVKVVIISYGILLPLLMQILPIRNYFKKFKIVAPPLALIPSFFLVFYVYHMYPWKYTGEVIELMLGMCFLFTIIFSLYDFSSAKKKQRTIWQLIILLATVLSIYLLSLGTSNLNNYSKYNSLKIKATIRELKAIENDILMKSKELGHSPFKRYFNQRLYTVVTDNKFNWMYKGKYANLTEKGLNKDRAKFFIDPWNMAYWLLYKHDKVSGRKRIVLYSFGPNRKQDSNHWTLKGDDVGVIIWDTALKKPYISENVNFLKTIK